MLVNVLGICGLPHSSQVYTGLRRLKTSGFINLKYSSFKTEIQRVASSKGVFFEKDDRLCFIDLLDGVEIDKQVLSEVSYYFKRTMAKGCQEHEKIYPYGLNYEVYENTPYLFEVKRLLSLNLSLKCGIKANLSSSLDALGVTFLPRVKHFESRFLDKPALGAQKVIFMARTWDPEEPGANLSVREKEDREIINEERAKIIRTLRKELGTIFLGGFSETAHSFSKYKDCVIDDPSLSKKSSYLNLVRQTPICIATIGLHGSVGWKLAEYIALGRAVISEQTSVIIPNGFGDGKNYLSYKDSDSCLIKVNYLLNNPTVVEQMMASNAAYYYEHLKPEKLMFNLLHAVD